MAANLVRAFNFATGDTAALVGPDRSPYVTSHGGGGVGWGGRRIHLTAGISHPLNVSYCLNSVWANA